MTENACSRRRSASTSYRNARVGQPRREAKRPGCSNRARRFKIGPFRSGKVWLGENKVGHKEGKNAHPTVAPN